MECQADWQRFLLGLHWLLFYLATYSSESLDVPSFMVCIPRAQKPEILFPTPWD